MQGLRDTVLMKDFTYIFLKNDRVGIHRPQRKRKVHPDEDAGRLGGTGFRHHPDRTDREDGGIFPRKMEAMDESLKVIDYIKNVAEYVKTKDGSISASQMLERFLFPSGMQYTSIGRLSGGERRRLYLLRILMEALM